MGERVDVGEPQRVTVDDVFRAVFEQLDRAFPEFGWIRTRRGWRATHEGFTHEAFAARAERVVCLQERGFLIHGGESRHWLAFLNGGSFPSGGRWKECMSELASRVGLSFGSSTKRQPTVAEALWEECRRTLLERDEGAAGRAYLVDREMPFAGAALGFIGSRDGIFRRAGVPSAAAWKARLLTAPDHDPSRWDGRVVGPITDDGEVVGLWGRAIAGGSPKYLLCGQGPGWLELGSRRADRVVVVEGPFDALRVEMATRDRVVALLGAAVTDAVLESFSGCSEVVFALDADAAGEQARRKLTKQLIMAPGDWSASFVVPEDLGDAKDFDELFRQEGEGAIEAALTSRMTWVAYAARRELEGREGAEEALALRRIGGLCRAAAPRWAAEVGLVVRDLVDQTRVDEAFVRRVLMCGSII